MQLASEMISIPKFTVRWTESLPALRTREHALSADVVGESGARTLGGFITSATKDMLGPLPGGGSRAETHIIRDASSTTELAQIWSLVKRERMERWLPSVEPGGRLGRNQLELMVERGGATKAYRVSDLERAPQPIQDLLRAAANLHGDIRMHGEPRVWPPGPHA